jgi:hypothetical protein
MNKQALPFFTCCLSFLLICLLAVPSCAQSSPVQAAPALPTSLVNPDFEQGSVGQVPDGWRSSTSRAGYAAEVSEENPKTGKRAALIRSVPTAQADPAPFGNLMQVIDATGLRGRRTRLRAAVRIEGADQIARAQLWLRVDRAGKQMGFFDNMDDRPITSGGWQYYQIVADIDEDAAIVNIGMMADWSNYFLCKAMLLSFVLHEHAEDSKSKITKCIP